MTALVERYRRWLMNTGFDGGQNSPPVNMIAAIEERDAEIESLTEKFLYSNSEGVRVEEENARLREAGQFLVDRISELEWTDDGYADLIKNWMGHVEPAIYRFRAALERSGE